jgi:hypothetical protein
MRWLDGIANDGITQGAHDSFTVNVSGSSAIYTVTDNTVAQGERWYDLCVFDVGEIKGVHTVTLCATGAKWAGFNTFGQVAFSEMATKVACEDDVSLCRRLMNVTVRLVGVSGPVTRCINFAPFNGNCADPVDVDVLFTGTPATGTVTFQVDDEDVWTHLNAKDEQHVVSATGPLTLVGDTYYADIAFDLQGGDTNNDDLVDIDDVTWLIATFGDPAHGGTHPWDGTRDADFSANLFVDTEDYTFLSANWLLSSEFDCGSPLIDPGHLPGHHVPLSRERARTSVAVAELPVWVADRADFNRDGVVDVTDVQQFEQLHGLGNALSSKIALTEAEAVHGKSDLEQEKVRSQLSEKVSR